MSVNIAFEWKRQWRHRRIAAAVSASTRAHSKKQKNKSFKNKKKKTRTSSQVPHEQNSDIRIKLLHYSAVCVRWESIKKLFFFSFHHHQTTTVCFNVTHYLRLTETEFCRPSQKCWSSSCWYSENQRSKQKLTLFWFTLWREIRKRVKWFLFDCCEQLK